MKGNQDRQIILYENSEKLRMHRKACFIEGIKMYISLFIFTFIFSKIKQCDKLRTFKHELKEYIMNTIFLLIFNRFNNCCFVCVLHFLHFSAFCILFLYFIVAFFVLHTLYFLFRI